MRGNERYRGITRRFSKPSNLGLIGLNLVVYYLMLRWLLDNVELRTVVHHLSQTPVWALLVSIVIHFATMALSGLRMMLLLGRSFGVAFSIVNIGYALNALIPLRLGEAIKIYVVHRLHGIPLTGIFSASVAEKLADLFKLLLLGAFVLAFATSEIIQMNVLLPIAVVVAGSIVALVLLRLNATRIVKWLPRGSRLRRISIEISKHAAGYPIARVLAISTGLWVLNIGLIYFVFNTFLPGGHVSVVDAAVLLLILALAIAIPSAPAGIGLFEAGIVAYLTVKLGYGNEAALAAAAVFHLVTTLPQLMLTGWLVWKRPM